MLGGIAALLLLAGTAAVGCSTTEREVLFTVRGMPVVLAPTDDRLCVEFGGRDGARFCWSTEDPEHLTVASSEVEGVFVVVATAPDDASAVVLRSDVLTRALTVTEASSGRYFVGVDVPPGDYGLAAERQDGSVVLRDDDVPLSLETGSGTMVVIRP